MQAQNYYPTVGNTDLSQTSNWTTSVNGIGGTNPTDFVTAGQTFNVTNYNGSNNATPTILSNWAVSGAGSVVVIGDGVNAVNFSIPAANTLTASISNITANAKFTVSNLTGITWPTTVDPASTVDFLNMGSVSTIPLTVTYGNVIFDNTTNNDAAGATGFTFAGNLTLQNGAVFNPSANAFDMDLVGGNNQTITGTGGTINMNKFIDSLKTDGNVTITNTNIAALSSLQLHHTGVGNVFSDGGNTITSGNNVNTWGSASGFNLTGTLVLNASSGTQKIDNNNTYTSPLPGAAVAVFNNITVNTTATGKVSFITNTSNCVITIKGNFVSNAASTGAITFGTTSPTTGVDTFKVGGNFTNNSTTTAFVYNAKTIYTFNGSAAQTIKTAVAAGETFSNLNINNTSSGGVTLSSHFFVSTNFNLANGLLNTTNTNILTLNAGSTATGGSATSYVNGPLTKKGNTAFTFPVGGNARYAPIGISAPATITNAFTASYAFNCASSAPTVNPPLTNVSSDELWQLTQTLTDPVSVTLWWENNVASGIDTYNGTLLVASYNGTSWSTDGQSAITASSPGNVTSNSFTVPTTNGGIGFGSSIRSSNPLLSPVSTSTLINNYNCGGNTGSITSLPAGGDSVYNYSWSPAGGTNATATGLSASTYTVTVTDGNGCSASASASLPTGLSVSNISSTLTACGGSTGTATVTATGGTPTYSYVWSNTGTTSGISALSAGLYTVIVSDQNNCTATAGVTVSTPNAPRDSITNIVNNLCYGDNNGSIVVGVNRGTPPYTYAWSSTPTQTHDTASSLTAGSYTVVITDAAQCVSSTSGTLVDPAQLRDSVASFYNGCGSLHNGTATAGVIGGTGSYTYLWNTTPSQTSVTATGLSAGTYTLSVSDSNNCVANYFFTITPGSIPSVTFNLAADSVQCDTVTQVSLVSFASPSGGVFSGTDVSANAFHPHTAGDGKYTIKYVFTNGSGCSDSATQSVRVHTCVSTGIDQLQGSANNINIYPNPTAGQFTVSGLTVESKLEVYNVLGMLLSTTRVTQESMMLSIADKPNGIYLVRIISKDGANAVEQKVIKIQ